MEGYVNPQEWIDEQHEKIERSEVAQQLDLFTKPTKDIMGFLRDHAPLKPWQSDIMAMLYNETMYFAPQRTTKMLNEGWASFVDYNIIAVQGMASLGQETDSSGIIDYSKHKMSVLGGKYSLNPYKLGFCLFMDIEERWNKGQFGQEWDECTDMKKRKDWDKKLGLGREKVFEVRKYYNDVTALIEFFTPDFCEKHEFFDWKKYPNGEVKIETRDTRKIKKKLLQQRINGGLPEIMLVDPNHKGKDVMFLEHNWDGRTLYPPYAKAVLQSLHYIWKKDVLLATRNKDGKEFIYVCTGEGDGEITAIASEEYVRE
jgi:stage V sporulation protein R